MGEQRRLKLTGEILIWSDDGKEPRHLANRVDVEVSDAGTDCAVGGLGTEERDAFRDPAPQVGRFVRRLDQVARRTARRREIVHPIPKPVSKRKRPPPKPDDLVPCPLCQGQPLLDCGLCDGEEAITRRRLEAFRQEGC